MLSTFWPICTGLLVLLCVLILIIRRQVSKKRKTLENMSEIERKQKIAQARMLDMICGIEWGTNIQDVENIRVLVERPPSEKLCVHPNGISLKFGDARLRTLSYYFLQDRLRSVDMLVPKEDQMLLESALRTYFGRGPENVESASETTVWQGRNSSGETIQATVSWDGMGFSVLIGPVPLVDPFKTKQALEH